MSNEPTRPAPAEGKSSVVPLNESLGKITVQNTVLAAATIRVSDTVRPPRQVERPPQQQGKRP